MRKRLGGGTTNLASPMRRLLAVVVLVLAACTEPGSGATTAACDHFSNTMRDVQAGALTPVELRSKLQEVDSDARLAHDDDVRRASAEVL